MTAISLLVGLESSTRLRNGPYTDFTVTLFNTPWLRGLVTCVQQGTTVSAHCYNLSRSRNRMKSVFFDWRLAYMKIGSCMLPCD